MIDQTWEVNFDGLVGPTHHYGGLGVGNLASQTHRGHVAKPRAAALQGIEKMRRCVSLGVRQAILPPQRRPSLTMLKRMGFRGAPSDILKQAADTDPHLLSAVWSASSMWAANAATVSGSSSCADGKLHFTVANLSSSLHRSIEPAQTLRIFRSIFQGNSFIVHRPLPSNVPMRDEGAANHMRLTDQAGIRGIDIFVYGDRGREDIHANRFFPRQGLEASRAIARSHGLDPRNTFFLRQHPDAVDAGAFHNDVVAASHKHVWLHHEKAYLNESETIDAIEKRFFELTGESIVRYEIPEATLSLSGAVNCYLFNGQLLSRDHGSTMVLLCPQQVHESSEGRDAVAQVVDVNGPVSACEYVELRESMNNGGGPACLRLRVPVTDDQWDQIPASVKWSDDLAAKLCNVIERFYPESITIADLTTMDFVRDSERAVEAIEQTLGLPSAWNLAVSADAL